MKPIKELQEVPFDDLEKLYIEQEASPDIDDVAEDPESAFREEYEKILKMPVYQRAIEDNIFSQGGICVQGLGCYPNFSLQALILFSIVYRITQDIEYNGKQYSISVFTRPVLSSAIGAKLDGPLGEILDFQYCRSEFLLKKEGEKLMFIFSEEA